MYAGGIPQVVGFVINFLIYVCVYMKGERMRKKKNAQAPEIQDVTEEAVEAPEVTEKESGPKKPIYKKWWFWVIIVIIIFIAIGSSGGDDEAASESADAAAKETAEESHIYDDAEVIDVMNGSGSDVIGQYSLIRADSSDITPDVLEDWYFHYIAVNDYNWCVILYSDMSDGSGIYGNTGFIEIGVIFEEDEYGVYSLADSSGATAYCYPTDDGTLEMYYYDEEEEDPDTSDEAEEDTAESSAGIVAILEQFGTFDETTVTGSGDDVVELPVTGIPVIMDITYSGSSNFIIRTVDSEGEDVDLLVNTIGSYSGTQTDYLDYADVTMLSVQSEGDWSITFKPLSSMPELISGAENTGDGVYYISTDSLTTITITYSGDSNFIVRGIGLSRADLLVNEIGAYEGTVIWAEEESFLIVTSEGTWTVSW